MHASRVPADMCPAVGYRSHVLVWALSALLVTFTVGDDRCTFDPPRACCGTATTLFMIEFVDHLQTAFVVSPESRCMHAMPCAVVVAGSPLRPLLATHLCLSFRLMCALDMFWPWHLPICAS